MTWRLFLPLAFAARLVAQPVGVNGWVAAIEAADRSVLAANAVAPTGLAAALGPRVGKMKDQARVVAAQVLEKLDTAEGAAILLPLTTDPNLSVAAAASRALRKAKNLPSGEALLAAIPKTETPAIRAHLYQAAGRAKAPLAGLRKLIGEETEPQALRAALAAAIRLGGVPERAQFAALIKDSKMQDVVPLMDLLIYTGDKTLAPALLPMFDSSEPIFRISPDPKSRMARRSDVAVWTAHELGLVPQLKLTSIRIFDPATIAVAKAACAKGKLN